MGTGTLGLAYVRGQSERRNILRQRVFSQQAAEKALKAVQIETLGKFFKVHDLLTLAESVNAPKNIVMRCLRINPYYTITRYPDVGNNTDKEAAQELLNGAREVLEWAKQTLKQ